MADDKKGDRPKDTVSDEEWARAMGEAEGASDYKVGRGKPPKEHQFKPGQSGNPKGRPTGKTELECLRDMRSVFWNAAMTPVTTTAGGKRTKRPALDAMYLRLFARAIEGHGPSIRFAHTLARETMVEHEEWQATFYERAQELIETLENQPDGNKDGETISLLNTLIERFNAKPTDKL